MQSAPASGRPSCKTERTHKYIHIRTTHTHTHTHTHTRKEDAAAEFSLPTAEPCGWIEMLSLQRLGFGQIRFGSGYGTREEDLDPIVGESHALRGCGVYPGVLLALSDGLQACRPFNFRPASAMFLGVHSAVRNLAVGITFSRGFCCPPWIIVPSLGGRQDTRSEVPGEQG